MITPNKDLISYSQVDRITSWFSGLDQQKIDKIPFQYARNFISKVYQSNMKFDTLMKFRKELEEYLNTL